MYITLIFLIQVAEMLEDRIKFFVPDTQEKVNRTLCRKGFNPTFRFRREKLFRNGIKIGLSGNQFDPIFVPELAFFNLQGKVLRPLEILRE